MLAGGGEFIVVPVLLFLKCLGVSGWCQAHLMSTLAWQVPSPTPMLHCPPPGGLVKKVGTPAVCTPQAPQSFILDLAPCSCSFHPFHPPLYPPWGPKGSLVVALSPSQFCHCGGCHKKSLECS